MPEELPASRSIDTLLAPGAISLISSIHFPANPYSGLVKPVALPPGRARLATKPAPTGSTTCANTIGTVRVACSKGVAAGMPLAKNNVRCERDQFRRLFAKALGIAPAPAEVDTHVTADRPTRFLQPLQERRETRLSFRVVRGEVHEHANAARALPLLRARRQRERNRRSAEQRDELAP